MLNTLKTITLAALFSLGLSYVHAWTAPTATPPGGNVSAPINVGATAQTKAGDLTIQGNVGIGVSTPAQKLDVLGSAQITGTIFGGGAQTTYGATTIRGNKNGWSGINFATASGANSGTLMMHPSYSGFYNATDNNWRMYVTDGGAGALGNVYVNDICTTPGGRCLSSASGMSSCVVVGTPAWVTSGTASCPAGYRQTGGSCDMYRGGDGREIGPRYCYPTGSGQYCSEGNGGVCHAYAVCCR